MDDSTERGVDFAKACSRTSLRVHGEPYRNVRGTNQCFTACRREGGQGPLFIITEIVWSLFAVTMSG